MKTSIQIQKEKEKKVFDAFSSYYGMEDIQQIDSEKYSYPDGVLMQNEQEIAVEQTDCYWYKNKSGSSYMELQDVFTKIAKDLEVDGYRGCVGIKLTEEALKRKRISKELKGIIRQYIDSPNNFQGSPMIEKIRFCKKDIGHLFIKDYQCEFPSSGFCKNLPLEEMITERVREKEEKLRNCKKDYSQHWLIISIPFSEPVGVDTREYNPFNTLFDKVFIQRNEIDFEEIRTEKTQVKQS